MTSKASGCAGLKVHRAPKTFDPPQNRSVTRPKVNNSASAAGGRADATHGDSQKFRFLITVLKEKIFENFQGNSKRQKA